MAACSQEAGLEHNVSTVNSTVLYEGKNKNSVPNCRKKTKGSHTKVRNMLCIHLQRKLYKRLKGCTILVHMFVPQAVRITEQGRRWEGKMESFRSTVCVSGVWSSVNLLLRQGVCVRVWVHTFVHVFVCDCIPDTRHNYLVIFVKVLILILQQVLHCLLTVATDEREKKRNKKYLRNSYNADTH